MSARDAILTRVREALADVPDIPVEQDTPIPWEYHRPVPVDDVIDLFVERVVDYKAVVERAAAQEVPGKIVAALQHANAGNVVLPAGVPESWRAAIESSGIEIRTDDPPLSRRRLNETAAVVTAAAVGCAVTGTIMLDHAPDQGRRALSLVPDVHVCVVRTDQVVTDVPEAVGRLGEAARAGQPMTWISGPSATSDIELSRVEGVHGPRRLHVILAES